jgi:methylmalonyl-CoA mutase N-terminal domain/subunit
MKERFNARLPRSWMLRFHTQTAGSTLTAQQPQNNLVRTTIQALAAVLGGTQSLHTNSMDEALALPTEGSALLALRTQQILANESGVINTVDPLGGSYYVESLTDAIEAESRRYMDRIEQMGGVLEAIAQGYIQEEIHQAAYRYQKRLESDEEVVVGINRFKESGSAGIPTLKLDPGHEVKQIERLKDLRQRRSQDQWQASLDALSRCARSTENLLPPIIACVRAHATIGEIAGVLRQVFGEFREPRV